MKYLIIKPSATGGKVALMSGDIKSGYDEVAVSAVVVLGADTKQ